MINNLAFFCLMLSFMYNFGLTFLFQQLSATNQISVCSFFLLKVALKEEEFMYIL